MLRTYDAPPAFTLAGSFRGTITLDASDGMPIVYRGVDLDAMKFMNLQNQFLKIQQVKGRMAELLLEANVKAVAAQQQLTADVAAIEQFNMQAAAVSERVLPILEQTAGAPASKTDQDTLYSWWYDRLGYSYQPPEKVQLAMNAFPQSTPPSLTTCFAAGTPVCTIEGFRPIEQIKPGDLVLSQDVETGSLDFRPILLVHHNAPNQTLRITLSDDEILLRKRVPSVLARGKGRAQARELAPGDALAARRHLAAWWPSSPGAVEPLYNLDVAENRSFFVGNASILVHDNTLPPARAALFDAHPNLDAASPSRR